MQGTIPLEKNVGFQRLLEEKFPSRRNITIHDVEKIGRGWETELYSFSIEFEEHGSRRYKDLVVRIFPGKDADRKSNGEFQVMKGLRRVGFPVPEVYLLERDGSVLGRPFIVMEEIRGQVMTDLFMESSEEGRRELILLFCRLFVDLHDIDLRTVFPEAAQEVSDDPYAFVDRKLGDMQRAIVRFQRTELNPVLQWLQARMREVPCRRQSILHLDYHPDNIIVGEGGSAVVIDWGSSDVGDPRSDLAWTLMLVGTFMDPAMRDVILTTYEEISGKKVQNVDFFEVMAVLRRLLDLTISLTGSAADRGMRHGAEEQMMMASEHYRRVLEYLHERTGLRILEMEKLIDTFQKDEE